MKNDSIPQNYKKKIKIFSNIIAKEDVDVISKFIDKHKMNKSMFKKKIGVAHKKGIAYRATFPDQRSPKLFKELEPILTKYANIFIEECKSFYKDENIFLYGFSINRLKPGIQLRLHQDVHNENTVLNYSASLYLNDDYEGGDIVFLNDFESKEDFPLYEDVMSGFKYNQEAYEMVIFPANLWHATDLLKKGTRDALILWATSNKDHEFKGFDSDFIWDPRYSSY